MKILLLAPSYFSLYKPILDELCKQGHQVNWIEDQLQPYDNRQMNINNLKKILFYLYNKICRPRERYWKKEIKIKPLYSDIFDLLICINGVSFHPILLQRLRKSNPKIRSILYLWDNLKYFNFLYYRDWFENILTFDIEDAARQPRLFLLPSYWFPTPKREVKYDLSIIGSDHDDRLNIVSIIYEQALAKELKVNAKVIISTPTKYNGIKRWIPYYLKKYKKNCKDFQKKELLSFTTTSICSLDETIRIIDESSCILDTDRPSQTGATQRVIWALARGKKIISTNTHLKKMPFYKENQIMIIDREKPVLDIEFIKNEMNFTPISQIEDLRIDKWVRTLLNG